MKMTAHPLAAALLVTLALGVGTAAVARPAHADSADATPGERVARALDDVLEETLGALRYVLRAIPHYGLPEVLDNGDIIIRRKDGVTAPVEPESEREPKSRPKDGTEPTEDGDGPVRI